MKVLYFVHTYGEKNGISSHVSSLLAALPPGVEAEVVAGSGGGLPFFSSLRIPLAEFPRALLAGFDVMHVHGYGNFFSFFGALAAHLRGKPLVWTIHGYPRMEGGRRLAYLFFRHFMAPYVFWKAGRIISVSSDILPLLRKETEKKITVMPNGVDTELFRPKGSYRKARFACFVGRLDTDKGPGRMLECSSLPLLFIGPDEGGERERLRQEAARLGRKAAFSETGYGGMPLEYEKCRYVVLPSRYEGFPLTLLEAAAMERPFISADVGEVKAVMRRLYRQPEKFLLKGNLQQRIDGLEKLDLSSELAAARRKVAQYSWKKVAGEVARIYRKLASS